MQVPMARPDITPADVAAVNEVLQTPYLSIGPRLEEFERRAAAYVGARHAVGVSSGTAGLHLCVIASGVGEGDLVITTPFSLVASANVVLYERAVPVFVDIEPETLNVDPALVAAAAHDLVAGGPAATRWLPRSLQHSTADSQFPSSFSPLRALFRVYKRVHLHDTFEELCAAWTSTYHQDVAGAGYFPPYRAQPVTVGLHCVTIG